MSQASDLRCYTLLNGHELTQVSVMPCLCWQAGLEELNKYDRLNQCRFHHKEPLWTLASHLTSLNSHMELLKHLLTYTFKALTVKYVFTLITMTRRFDGFMVFLSSYEGGIDPNLGNTTFLFMMQEAFYNGELCGTKYNFHSLHFSAS